MNIFRLMHQMSRTSWLMKTHICDEFKHTSCRYYSSHKKAKHHPKTAVLMVYTGGPKCEEEINCFVKRVLADPMLAYGCKNRIKGKEDAERIIPEIRKRYESIGHHTPQFAWIKAQTKLVEERLDATCVSTAPHKTFLGCQFVKPSIFDALRKIAKFHSIENILILPMYPQFSCGLTGGAFNAIYKFFKENPLPDGVKWGVVDNWATTHAMIKNAGYLIKKAIMDCHPNKRPFYLIFAARPMLPIIYDVGEFYPYLVGATVMHTMRYVGASIPYTLAWHHGSMLDKWMEPIVEDTIKNLICQGHKQFLLAPVCSVVENLITYYNYDIYFKQTFLPQLGEDIVCRRISAPNLSSLFITSVSQVCKEALLEHQVIPYYLRQKCVLCQNSQCGRYKRWFTELLTERRIQACEHRHE